MELKTKYQYTYFIYPYIVKEKEYIKYLQKLLLNTKFKMKIFNREKDLDLYSYFLPKVRENLFWTMNFSKYKMSKLDELGKDIKTNLIAKYPCTIFEYDIKKDIQGKIEKKDGIFFEITKIELVCFNTGICFMIMKTNIEGENTLSDVCNFNYKFRDIKSNEYELKGYENIKIQTDIFNNVKQIDKLIEEITGNNIEAKKLNLNIERFITYSYVCIEQEEWKETNKELLEKSFYKLANVEKSDYIVDFEKDDINNKILSIRKSKNEIYGCSKIGTVLLTSDINAENCTELPYRFERQYLYQYIYELYKRIYLKKLNLEFFKIKNIESIKQKFIKFTQLIWIEEITNNNIGNLLDNEWRKILNLEKLYLEVKNEYDLAYKNSNIDKTARTNKMIVIILSVLLVMNIITIIKLF